MTNRFVWGIINNVVIVCCCGGTGRRKGLKIPRWKHRVGSIPISSTSSVTLHPISGHRVLCPVFVPVNKPRHNPHHTFSRTTYHSRRLFFYTCGKVTSHSLLSLTLRKRSAEKSCRTFPAFQNKSRLLILFACKRAHNG